MLDKGEKTTVGDKSLRPPAVFNYFMSILS